ncbi:disulfide reductase [candidate division TA06 bacterium DG_24]|uniref:Disulfide reductase n=3 Tax=Bacteria division TA06 TaxID=1156500 RepID=A0A0S8JM77_UNCT6|nr:MAG: disulfide reductase [candidate division TA06 bacterium DG_24]KPK69013.1 MAG: disulfide reductase [candidate division TA06 bacterium SM23_40]KPL10546.1 MAG: disulfide reductase [candidate division TA06 bacterium SM1_40]
MARIGVFVCHCGKNIGATVDCERVAGEAAKIPGVVHSENYLYMCSDPGQLKIKDAIRDKKLDGVVVAACSPHMHERTFRRAVAEAGLNPYLAEMSNVREHCSWVHQDIEDGTAKAIDLVRVMVEKVKLNQPLTPIRVPVTKRALVIGGGVAGIQAALDIANGERDVILLERDPSIGGHMSQLSETFPTLDCSQCILTPKMVEVASHPRITLLTYSELEEVDGYVGNFQVKIRKKARSVDMDVCTGCGVCMEKCPVKKIPSEFNVGLSMRPAIYTPFPQAVPNVPVIDKENCIYYIKGKCKVCEKFCGPGAIRFDQEDEIVTYDVGAIVVATGYSLYSVGEKPPGSTIAGYGEYGYGNIPDVIDALQFERLASASGPTEGHMRRPSDGAEPKTVAFIQCVGSRCPEKGITYCSKICCMYTVKHAMLYKHKVHDGDAYIFYMDIRSGGKNYEEFVRRAIEEDGVVYLRGRVSRLYRKDGKVIVRGADTLSGTQVEIAADMVVTANATLAQPDSQDVAQKIGIAYDKYGFFSEKHPKLAPVETNTAGVFLAGACQAPKDIPEAVAQASGAAAKVLEMFAVDELEREPTIAVVNEDTCVACFFCKRICPYSAVEEKEIKDRDGNLIKLVSHVNEGLCQGCGLCVVACPSKSIELLGFTDEQLFAEINALAE